MIKTIIFDFAGVLTQSKCFPQIAKNLGVSTYWVYDCIRKGYIRICKDSKTDLYLFPDNPATIQMFQKLKGGQVEQRESHPLEFTTEPDDLARFALFIRCAAMIYLQYMPDEF